MGQEQAFHAKLVHYKNFMQVVMLAFSKDNTPATLQYHTYILHHMYGEREIQEVPYKTGRSTAGVALEAKPVLSQFHSPL